MKLTNNLKVWAFLATAIVLGVSACAKRPAGQATSNPNTAPENVRSSKDVVKVSASNLSIGAGENAEASISLSISPGYHVNANPATFPYLLATQVTPGSAAGITADKPIYPAAEHKKFAFADEPLAVYEGHVQIKLPLQAAAAAKGTISLPINLRVQACDQEKCFSPDTLNTSISLEVK